MKIYHYLIAMVFCVTLTSCKTQLYYQVCDVKSSLSQSAQGCYEYKDASCTVSYNLWCNGGNPGFTFTNDTDEIIYVDLAHSFYIENGVAYDYYLNRAITSSAAYAESISTGKSGTAYGYWNTAAGLTPGLLTASVGTNSSAQRSTSVTTEEKSVIAIPPHQSKFITEYNISSKEFYGCEFNLTPKKKDSHKYEFSPLNSPLKFSNYITYRIGEDVTDHSFTNDFYVGSITIYREDDAFVEKTTGCTGKPRKIDVLRDASPQKYFIKYYYRKDTPNSNYGLKKEKYEGLW